MKFIETKLANAFEITPTPFMDDRGSFARLYCKNELLEIGHTKEILQINHSQNHKKGTLRGLHFQAPPFSEVKIIRCIKGAVFDIIIDIRKGSPTFLKHILVELSDKNQKALYVPEGFAHGFITLTDGAELIYYSTQFFTPNADRGLNYKDPMIKLDLPLSVDVISEKDANAEFLPVEFEGIELIK